MPYINQGQCRKCGADTSVRWIGSTGMDIQPTGMKKECNRCGFSEFIKALDE